ncbi:uncharacterized protein LOC123425037 [Hordeum vulgare subsp. vulgare]|uniref:uncharacterized protein LOC123425037 n=1 Tax=Hordeum vulgare subsp. vulgare TaxID=112509 RepID=UPI001D1A4112|nr:uncharacterized protein LOC123425037 [Hordeum vulgare subsp. vulgare]
MAGDRDDAAKVVELARKKLEESATAPMSRLTDGSGNGEFRIVGRMTLHLQHRRGEGRCGGTVGRHSGEARTTVGLDSPSISGSGTASRARSGAEERPAFGDRTSSSFASRERRSGGENGPGERPFFGDRTSSEQRQLGQEFYKDIFPGDEPTSPGGSTSRLLSWSRYLVQLVLYGFISYSTTEVMRTIAVPVIVLIKL